MIHSEGYVRLNAGQHQISVPYATSGLYLIRVADDRTIHDMKLVVE